MAFRSAHRPRLRSANLAAALIGLAGLFATTPYLSAVDYQREIRPLLAEHCLACHGPDAQRRASGLRLDERSNALAPADSGLQAIVPGHPELSELVRRIETPDPSERMPPAESGQELTEKERQVLRAWIADGAPWQTHWSFLPPQRPPLPPASSWARNPIDHFVWERLQSEQLVPSPQAAREALIRRVTLGLTGLPPTLAEIDAFLSDEEPDAYRRLVDRLLQSPHYGEHWARPWLDAARYGDTHGLHLDNERSMWPYRDWVIDALNDNQPFDQFTIEQIAGDLLPGATVSQRVATGFQRCNVTTNEEGSIDAEFQVRYAMDRVETTAATWLGLTLNCASCHDHKYDPISQREYYQLFAYFYSVTDKARDGDTLVPPPSVRVPNRVQALRHSQLVAQLADVDARLATLKNGADAQLESWSDLRSERRILLSQKQRLESQFAHALVLHEQSQPAEVRIRLRGQYDQLGDVVQPSVPAVLPPLPPTATPNRLAFAQWLVDPAQPLMARVIINRIWQQHFGVGLVTTVEDFGSRGERPSHPELLDWLAVEFRESGWDLKQMHRLIVNSATFQQSSSADPEAFRRDPDNRLLARGPRYRLDAETIRDSVLASSGLLVQRLGGPSGRVYQPAGLWEAIGYTGSNTAHFVQDHGAALYRRSLYTFWKRTSPPPAMQLLDAPSREVCVLRRQRTNTPTQALTLMNDVQFVEAARCLAERVLRATADDLTDDVALPPATLPPADTPSLDAQRVSFAWRLATGRRPEARERDLLVQMLTTLRADFKHTEADAERLIGYGEKLSDKTLHSAELAAWTVLCNTLLNLDEVLHQW